MNVREFSERVGVSPHTIRYYEKAGLLGTVRRLPNGYRDFSEKDIDWIAFIQRLKDTGMPLAEIRRYAEMRVQGDSTLLERQQLLEAHAKKLKENISRQQHYYHKLIEKIAFYQSVIENKTGA
ncbi:MAG: MerR family transcriptional regulator [Desulfobacterales bacterium]|nr:MAG: MerR family transcriptional regulator [Desulfobacterales bacterium]